MLRANCPSSRAILDFPKAIIPFNHRIDLIVAPQFKLQLISEQQRNGIPKSLIDLIKSTAKNDTQAKSVNCFETYIFEAATLLSYGGYAVAACSNHHNVIGRLRGRGYAGHNLHISKLDAFIDLVSWVETGIENPFFRIEIQQFNEILQQK
ncbi:hypothetical protein ACO0K0_18090 [Undibacterium sp. SXout11W]|uniref:hypothetical protein n=1 Tax=Undibacterium sp. SXout11W TaxID=3413050 RepID=UPI003BF2DD98